MDSPVGAARVRTNTATSPVRSRIVIASAIRSGAGGAVYAYGDTPDDFASIRHP
jgi:hypothetical protein